MKKTALLAGIGLLLCGCTQLPRQISLTPDVAFSNYRYSSMLPAKLETVDQRINHYLISLREEDQEVSTLIASGSNIRQQIQQTLSDGFSKQDLSLQESAPITIKATLLKCQADIVQKSLSYTGHSSVQIKVTVTTPKGSLAKLFKSEQSLEEAFNVDPAKLQSTLNTQLSRTLERILNDGELRKAIENAMISPAS